MEEKIASLGIVPVVVLNDAKNAAPLAQAMCEGGLPVAEVTFRTAAAEESIRIMSQQYPEMLVGAGTVLNQEQVDRALAAGAKFIVSPGLSVDVVTYCQEKGVPVFPGVVTPSEVMTAVGLGCQVVKFFPAENFGGLATIKALAGPFPTLKFMPTGGINAKNAADYLRSDKILACGGSWMVKGSLIDEGRFDQIKALCAEAAELVKTLRG
jgi:2-dehydro-3-deoxyphosphogluconate aldolase/(4S)-4-hydroxy-2-oxoglutarate aldolase